MLGDRIAQQRKALGLTQRELAAMLDVSPSTLGMYEQGRRLPTPDILVSLSRKLGVSTDYLLKGKAQDLNDLSEKVPILKGRRIYAVEPIFTWTEGNTLLVAIRYE